MADKTYRIYYQVTSDFFEDVSARNAEEAIRVGTAYVSENSGRVRFGAAQSIDVVKIESLD